MVNFRFGYIFFLLVFGFSFVLGFPTNDPTVPPKRPRYGKGLKLLMNFVWFFIINLF